MRSPAKAVNLTAIGRPIARERARAATGSSGRARLVAAVAVVLGLAALLPVIQSSGVTTTGYRVRQLEQANVTWEARVASLEAEVAELSSQDRIEQRARELGMVPVEDPVYVQVEETGPGALHVPRRYTPPSPTTQPADRNWWEVLRDLVAFW